MVEDRGVIRRTESVRCTRQSLHTCVKVDYKYVESKQRDSVSGVGRGNMDGEGSSMEKVQDINNIKQSLNPRSFDTIK